MTEARRQGPVGANMSLGVMVDLDCQLDRVRITSETHLWESVFPRALPERVDGDRKICSESGWYFPRTGESD